MRRLLCTLLALLLLFAGGTSFAEEPQHLSVGGFFGLNSTILTPPDDAPGEAQFMHGTAFNGMGATLGASARFDFLKALGVQLDLMLSYENGAGYEDDSVRRREMSFNVLNLKVPLTLRAGWRGEKLGVNGGLGLELAIPLAVGAELKEENIPANESFELDVEGLFSAGLTAELEISWRARPELWIPLAFRATWYPATPATSTERFEGYVSPAEPGVFLIGFDWALYWTIGARYELL